jgi:hypothetical protein
MPLFDRPVSVTNNHAPMNTGDRAAAQELFSLTANYFPSFARRYFTKWPRDVIEIDFRLLSVSSIVLCTMFASSKSLT